MRPCASTDVDFSSKKYIIRQLKTQYVRVDRTAPTVSTESGYYLQMKDDFGHAFSSPIFNITRERAHPFATG